MKQLKGFKHIFILLIITGLLLVGCSSGSSTQTGASNKATTPDKIVVGYTNFNSGPLAALGKSVDGSIQLALEDFNKTAKVPIELRYEDIGSTPVTAKNGFKKLLETNPTSILSIFSSTQFDTVKDDLANSKTTVVIATTLSSIFKHGYDWVFGTNLTDEQSVMGAIKYYHEKLGKNKIAVLLPNDTTGKEALEAIKKVASADNFTIIPEFFQPGTNDYTANITSVRRQNPDMYFVNTKLIDDEAKVIKQLSKFGVPAEMISANLFIGDQDFQALFDPKEVDGLYGYQSTYINKDDQKVKDFDQKYKKKTGLDAGPTTLYTYDAAMLLFNAAEKAGGDKQKIHQYMKETKGYQGLAGTYNFDSKGLGRHDMYIMQMGPSKNLKVLEHVKMEAN